MRKAQKKQIEEFTMLLEQAHKEIKRFIETHNTAAPIKTDGLRVPLHASVRLLPEAD